MTRPGRHLAPPPKRRVHPQRLLVILGAASLVYAWALGPILTSLQGQAARRQQETSLKQRLATVSAANRALSGQLTSAEQTLKQDVADEQSLRSQLAELKSQKPPAPPPQPAVPGISVPPVHSTTGASGLP